MTRSTRVAALQIEAEVGNIDANLAMCSDLAEQAVREGAEWIVLPEFFSTGVANRPELAQNAPAADGAPTRLLRDLARTHGVHVGGSSLVRDADGHVRNAFFLAGPDGDILGRHDKDIPTMWESSLYIGGGDPGRILAGGARSAWLCAGSCCAARPPSGWRGRSTSCCRDQAGGRSGVAAPPVDPVAAAAQQHPRRRLAVRLRHLLRCARRARGPFRAAELSDAASRNDLQRPLPGRGLGHRGGRQGAGAPSTRRGPGLAVADVVLGRSAPRPVPDRFWLQKRGVLPALAWAYQNPYGRAQYARTRGHQAHRPAGSSDDRQ
ncbi:carbon-nitrogen hydrolase family protein [Prescottella defluvii]|nr:carbon-nitrogen hydrolase family protein [Prescottella defluvii]